LWTVSRALQAAMRNAQFPFPLGAPDVGTSANGTVHINAETVFAKDTEAHRLAPCIGIVLAQEQYFAAADAGHCAGCVPSGEQLFKTRERAAEPILSEQR
jgi:hypothetical protein